MSRVTDSRGLGGSEARLVLTAGARAAESLLFGLLDRLLDEAVADPTALARPVMVVVPPASLRRHLAARLVAHRGRPVAGVAIVPVLNLARGIVERSLDHTTNRLPFCEEGG